MALHLTGLAVYPLKSAAGLARDRARVTPRGLELDRRWMLVDPHGEFITGREHPRLVTVSVRPRGTGLLLAAPGQAPLLIDDARGGGAIEVRVWHDRVPARPVDARADGWFSTLLGVPCALVHMGEDDRREVAVDFARPGDLVSFADGFPLLLTAHGSLAELRERSGREVSMARFRPNVTVDGAPGFAEDRWRRILIGSVEFEVAGPCERCVMTTIDPRSGIADPQREPLLTLSRFRRDASGRILFGVNLIPRSRGTLRVGDPVQVLA